MPDQDKQFEIRRGTFDTQVIFSGIINEESKLPELAAQLQGKLIFDLAGIQRINSSGVRKWLDFLNALRAKGATYRLERCSPAMVTQFNLISDFLVGAEVASVQASYFCSACRSEHFQTIDVGPQTRSALDRLVPCPKCQTPMQFDDLPDAFLAFQSRLKPTRSAS